MVVEWVGSKSRDEVLSILDSHQVVAAAVNDASDIVADPHFQFRSLFPVPGSEHDSLLVPGPLVRTDDDPVPAYPFGPVLGEHTASVLEEELGLSADDIASLERRGTISTVGVVEPADDPLHSGAVA